MPGICDYCGGEIGLVGFHKDGCIRRIHYGPLSERIFYLSLAELILSGFAKVHMKFLLNTILRNDKKEMEYLRKATEQIIKDFDLEAPWFKYK